MAVRVRIANQGCVGRIIGRGLILSLFVLSLGTMSVSKVKENYAIPENPLQGSQIFFKKGCIECHRIWDLGSTFGPDLTQVGRRQSFFGLAGSLWSHSPKMIEVMKEKGIERPVLTPQEIEELSAYLYYLGFFDPPGDSVRGEALFSSKGCLRCHSLSLTDKKGGLPLDRYGRYISPVFIATALWNHSGTIHKAMVTQSFGPGEMEDILAFIRANSLNDRGDSIYIPPGNPKMGKAVFAERRCTLCHGNDGQRLKGDSLKTSLTEIVASMWSHSYRMWTEMKERNVQVPRFSVQEMADLTAFLYFVPYYGEEGQEARGEKIFVSKGCAHCHSQEAADKKKGVNLAKVSRQSVFELISEIWNHLPQMEKMTLELNLPWPRFEKDEMRDLLLYIQSLK